MLGIVIGAAVLNSHRPYTRVASSCHDIVLSIAWHFIMKILTPEEGLQIVQLYYENSLSVKNLFCALRSTYGPYKRPTIRNTITLPKTQHLQKILFD